MPNSNHCAGGEEANQQGSDDGKLSAH
jgi:hypothetical protein